MLLPPHLFMGYNSRSPTVASRIFIIDLGHRAIVDLTNGVQPTLEAFPHRSLPAPIINTASCGFRRTIMSQDSADFDDDGPIIRSHMKTLNFVDGYSPNQAEALKMWLDMFNSHRDGDKKHKQRLLQHLGPAQLASFLLLCEWWELLLSLEDSPLMKYIIEMETGDAPFNTGVVPDYDAKLAQLWREEFSSQTLQTKSYATGIMLRYRLHAAIAAAGFRIFRAITCAELLVNPNRNPEDEVPEDLIPRSVNPCPWLEQAGPSQRYPHYLWDCIQKRTVETRSITGIIEYAVISHTWGRWQTGEWHDVDGVPWRVPSVDSNNLYDVRNLPSILGGVKLPSEACKYVWFDLVCIPQGKSDIKLQQQEISRQADIFRSARWAIAWLNTIADWNEMQIAMDWTSILHMHNHVGSSEFASLFLPLSIRNMPRPLQRRPTEGHIMGFMVPVTEAGSQEGRFNISLGPAIPGPLEPSGWFTSLWTLQEICMRPDMLIASKDWGLLRLGSSRFIATVDHLTCLFRNIERRVPTPVAEVGGVLNVTGLVSLTHMSPVDIIAQGSRRYCSDANRAIAIMSVLGTTEWYSKHCQMSADAQATGWDADAALLGKYPMDFVDEFRSKFGAVFFAADLTDTDVDTGKESHHFEFADGMLANNSKIISSDLTGTMLPISTQNHEIKFASPASYMCQPSKDHTSVRSWTVNLDGSVYIPEASILASYASALPDAPLGKLRSQISLLGGMPFPSCALPDSPGRGHQFISRFGVPTEQRLPLHPRWHDEDLHSWYVHIQIFP